MSVGECQIAHCMRPAAVELVVHATGVVRACDECHRPEVIDWLRKGHNVGRYGNMDGEPLWIRCTGDPPGRSSEACGVPPGGWAPPRSAYWIPCVGCRRAIVFHWPTKPGLRCDACKPIDPVCAEPVDAKDELGSFVYGGRPWGDGEPFWNALKGKMRKAAQEAWEERSAIMEYDGEMIHAEAEHRAYHLVEQKAADAGLLS